MTPRRKPVLPYGAELGTSETVTSVVAEARSGQMFCAGGYWECDADSFQRDVERAVAGRWRSPHIRDAYAGNLDRLAWDLVLVYDRYVLQLTKLLVSREGDTTGQGELYRSAQYLINSIRGLRRHVDPEDALLQTWEAVMGDRLKILSFDGRASLKTWVQKILTNEILQVARRNGLA
jgi:hypothetical protein